MKQLFSHLIIIVLATIFVSVPASLFAQEPTTPEMVQEVTTPAAAQEAITPEVIQVPIAPEMAQEAPPLEVAMASICQDVVDLEPVGSGISFAASTEKLYFFTKIVGAQDPTQTTHVWYFGEAERARVSLAVNSASWRTYSSKTIQAHEVGSWRVEVLDSEGSTLKVLQFTITPETAPEEAKPEAVSEEVKPETVPELIQPEAVLEEVQPETIPEEVKPEQPAH
jgi:hypothetical protein